MIRLALDPKHDLPIGDASGIRHAVVAEVLTRSFETNRQAKMQRIATTTNHDSR